ncbi:hypothetical protein RB195_000099 [Necator americanus]|uniref:Methyltransferase type 11 domain-containing protein n=1 Tax=Necator americanus TaxID=51031 RepID=A0ABR1D7X7_NECAM
MGRVKYSTLAERVFFPNYFKLITAAQPLPVLDFVNRPTCEQVYLFLLNKLEAYVGHYPFVRRCRVVFADWLKIAHSNSHPEKPPKELAEPLRSEFLLNGYSTLIEEYRDNHAKGVPSEWNQINEWMKLTEPELEKINPYGKQGMAVYRALQEYPPQDMKGLIVGSIEPWVEVYALRNGAKEVLTVDYQNITITGTNKVEYIHPLDLVHRWQEFEGGFDFVISFSSIEHSGLGRYGDPLDPIGDLREIWKITCFLKSKGYFYLGIPRGQDSVVFNLHRIYGVMRLAMVMTGFEWIATYRGDSPVAVQLTQNDLEYFSKDIRLVQQDLFVLRKL